MLIFPASPPTYSTIMSPTKTTASESSRPRKVSSSTQKQRKPFKQRKIPKSLKKVPVLIYGAKMDDFINGDATIQSPVVSESLAPSSLHVATPQDKANLASYFPPANFVDSQIPVLTRVDRGAEPSESHWHVPIPFHYGPDFNSHPEDNILSLTSNPCQSCGRYDPSCHFIPPSSSIGSLSTMMEYGVASEQLEPSQYQQLLDPSDPNTPSQYSIPQPILPGPYLNASSTFPGNLYDIYHAEITDSSESHSSHLTMSSANDGVTLPFPNYDANNPLSYYM